MPSTDDLSDMIKTEKNLSGIGLLVNMPTGERQKLEKKVRWCEYNHGDIIIDRDTEENSVYFLVRGKLRVQSFDDSGEAIFLADILSGDTFGELSAIDGLGRSARISAGETSLVASLEPDLFKQLLIDCPEVASSLLVRFANIIRESNNRIHSLTSRSPSQRVYKELLRLSDPSPEGDGSWIIPILPKHDEIAGWTGADKEDVAQAIGQLARQNVVKRRNRTLVINDRAKLQLLANQ